MTSLPARAVHLVRKRHENIAAGQFEGLPVDDVGLPTAFEIAYLDPLAVGVNFQRFVCGSIVVSSQHGHAADSKRSEIEYPPLAGRVEEYFVHV